MSDDTISAVPDDGNLGSPAVPPPYPSQYSYPPQPERPGRTLGIIGFVLSFFGLVDIAGLIISLVALSKSRHAGQKNGFALAGIIISIVGILVTAGIITAVVIALVQTGQTCARLGDGTHVIGNSTYTCTPTSFNVSTN